MAHKEINQEMRDCIQACTDCHEICLETISHCLSMGGKHADPAHIKLLQDCAQICATSADFMLRGSEYHAETCGTCAILCEACADSCESMADGDELMMRCAETCRACAESCRSMSGGSSSRAAG
jgi:hypothetical protein